MPKSEFPKEYLGSLAKNQRDKLLQKIDVSDEILIYSGGLLNWIGEYINDDSIHWELKTLPIDSLTLTGTNPHWNEIIIDRADRSPAKLRQLLQKPEIKEMFIKSQYSNTPILVRRDEDKLKVLDGMNRVIAALRDGISEIDAYVGTREGEAKAIVEPHVIYDLIRAFQQRGGKEEDLKGGLRFLLNAYDNTRKLLEERFSKEWIRDENTQRILREVLEN